MLDIIKHDCLDIISVHSVDKIAKYTRSINDLIEQAASSMSFVTLVTAYVKKPVDRTVEEVHFKISLQQQHTKLRMMQIQPGRSILVSPELDPWVHAPPKRLVSSD